MEWKEFLKPDWKKIILAVVIFALIPIRPDFWGHAFNMTTGEQRPYYNLFVFDYVINLSESNFLLTTLLVYISAAILSYLLSCTIIFLYNRYKK